MLKKISVSLLALLYTVSVLGVALNFHYCLNQVASVKLYNPVKTCTPLKAVKAMKCCKDKHIDLKVKDGHQASVTTFSAQVFVADLPQILFYVIAPAVKAAAVNNVTDRGPPLSGSKPPVYLINRNFRI